MLEALTKIFEEIVNNFYKKGVSVTLSDTPDTAYCQGNHITLPRHLLEEFTQQKLPRFTVLYHELGHALYSHDLNTFINKWESLPIQHNSYAYDPKYMHLLNWIEDFYIEDQLVQDYSFLTDLIKCLKRLTLPYDLTEIDKAFNHYYVKGYTTPSLATNDALKFKCYITDLLSIRKTPGFGKGPISLLSTKSKETQYIKMIIEFYNWCISKSIFDGSVLPPLSNPNNVIVNNSNNNNPNNNNTQSTDNVGNITDHSHIVGQGVEVVPRYDKQETLIFNDQFVAEQKLIKQELLRQSTVESTESSLDGLFNNLFIDTSLIQNKVIVPNFFNPNRLIDQVLFKRPDKSFNNVSIYRDISGSTFGKDFALINNVCKYLNDKLPIEYNFYLYASGDISILQTTFEDWECVDDVPDVYADDPIYQQMGHGTNSSAIADVITEQLNDKWLNIIITDGDLNDLMNRQDINSLLNNVFVISIHECTSLKDIPNCLVINEEEDINRIASAVLHMKEVN